MPPSSETPQRESDRYGTHVCNDFRPGWQSIESQLVETIQRPGLISLTEREERVTMRTIYQTSKERKSDPHAFHNRIFLGRDYEAVRTDTYRPTQPRPEYRRGERHAEIGRSAVEQLEDYLLGRYRLARRQGLAARL